MTYTFILCDGPDLMESILSVLGAWEFDPQKPVRLLFKLGPKYFGDILNLDLDLVRLRRQCRLLHRLNPKSEFVFEAKEQNG